MIKVVVNIVNSLWNALQRWVAGFSNLPPSLLTTDPYLCHLIF